MSALKTNRISTPVLSVVRLSLFVEKKIQKLNKQTDVFSFKLYLHKIWSKIHTYTVCECGKGKNLQIKFFLGRMVRYEIGF